MIQSGLTQGAKYMTVKNTVVTLDQAEVMSAVYTGALRFYEAQTKGFSNGPDGASPDWNMSIEGALTEMAYAKFRGVYYGHPVNNFHGADVGDQVQVRSTRHRTGGLIIRPADPIDHYYVLVIGKMPTYRIVGWIQGQEAITHDEWKKAPDPSRPPCWVVPQDRLYSFNGTTDAE